MNFEDQVALLVGRQQLQLMQLNIQLENLHKELAKQDGHESASTSPGEVQQQT